MTNTKRALITGVTGQDGAYLSKLLLEKGYEVYGTARRGASEKFSRLEFLNVLDNINIIDFDLLEFSNIQKTIQSIMPHEIYNLAAQSFVPTSFDLPILTSDINALGTLRILDSILTINKNIKFYQASTSEMFGKVKKTPQDEETLIIVLFVLRSLTDASIPSPNHSYLKSSKSKHLQIKSLTE